MRMRPLACSALLVAGCLAGASANAVDFVEFETAPVRPLARSDFRSELYAVNIPDDQLEIFSVTDAGLVRTGSVPVGMRPCAVAVAPDGRVWVVNHLSDSVSIVEVAATPPRVVQTLLVGDEPRDIVFAGYPRRAFVTTAHRGQHRTHASLAAVPGAGDPLFTTPSTPRADVWVFDAASPGTAAGGDPVAIMSFFADTPRALAVSKTNQTVYVAAFHSGNQTAGVSEPAVCDGFDPNSTCVDPGTGFTLPAGNGGPSTNVFGAAAPETGLIAKFDNASNQWRDNFGNDWSALIPFRLPDHDVFAVNANTLNVGAAGAYDHVGTILFNMAVNPVSGNVYVSNTELPNHVRFEGPGNHGGSTVQGHLSESRITVLSGTSSVAPRHLNKHIDYDALHTDVPDLVDPTTKNHSLATPVAMEVSGDGSTLYVAAFGSAKIGVFSTAALEADSFDPTVASAGYLSVGGGPGGLSLDEDRDRLYVHTRFDNAVAVVDLVGGGTLQTVPLHNPEPATVVAGRPFLYDAFGTSGNGEASCSSCHIFGDMDDIAWNLGNPDGAVSANTQPSPVATGGTTFHPMKGPMTTQTLRGLATHGAMHWRGDRVDGHFGTDPCTDPTGSACDEERAFKNFIVAFEGLVGHDGILPEADMQAFTDFALQITLPPNPVRDIDNSLSFSQSKGLIQFERTDVDGGLISCEFCHRLDPSNGFFGTGGGMNDEGEPQDFKIPHLRNVYAKIGMFGMPQNPDGSFSGFMGDQIRGFGFLHDGIVDTLEHFVGGTVFELDPAQQADLEQFMLAFDSDLAPVVGQQVTLDATNAGVAGPRIDTLQLRAAAPFTSLVLGGLVTECDLVVKGTVAGAPRGWLYQPGTDDFADDVGGTIGDAALRALAVSQGPLTFTCVPPGAGTRAGINRDRDALLDGLDNCANASNDPQTDTDGDAMGDACDPDDDDDGLLDDFETGTGVFVSSFDTGSDPLLGDSDGDGFADGFEVQAGTDPNDSLSVPVLPALSRWGFAVLVLFMTLAGVGVGLWRRPVR